MEEIKKIIDRLESEYERNLILLKTTTDHKQSLELLGKADGLLFAISTAQISLHSSISKIN